MNTTCFTLYPENVKCKLVIDLVFVVVVVVDDDHHHHNDHDHGVDDHDNDNDDGDYFPKCRQRQLFSAFGPRTLLRLSVCYTESCCSNYPQSWRTNRPEPNGSHITYPKYGYASKQNTCVWNTAL